MRIGIFKVIAIVGLALVFNACGSRIDESVQDNIQEEQYSQDSNSYSEESDNSANNEEESSSEESYSYNDEGSSEVYQQQEGDPIDILIESKIDSAGKLTFTEYEFSDEIALRAIERRISFTLTDLDDRDAMIKTIENIFKKQGETYRIVKEKKVDWGEIVVMTVTGAEIGTFVPGAGTLLGGFGGGLLGLGYSLKDVVIDKFAKKTSWLISKSPEETTLNIRFVKVQK